MNFAIHIANNLTDKAMDLFGFYGQGGFARAYGPHRLVGDDHVVKGRYTVEALLHLLAHHEFRDSLLALLQGLSHAEDRLQPLGKRLLYLEVYRLVRLVEVFPPLGVADDDVGAACVPEHT